MDDGLDPQLLAILDLSLLEEAFGCLNENVTATLQLFLDSTRPLLTTVEESLVAGEYQMAGEAAHSAKGACNVTGAFRLGALCAGICMALRNDEPAKARQLAAELAGDWALVAAEISRVTKAISAISPESGAC